MIHWDWLKETPKVRLTVIDLGLSRGLRLAKPKDLYLEIPKDLYSWKGLHSAILTG